MTNQQPQSPAHHQNSVRNNQRSQDGLATDSDTESYTVSDGSEESTDDEGNARDDHDALESYRSLGSRKVDLVGDYAGDEKFLIEGDSLLLRCFQDEKLDFQQGLQLLHATYNVESFLHNLIQRKCNFDIAFFECNKVLCAPQATDQNRKSRYLLARAAIIIHLQKALAQSHPHINIRTYESWVSPAFLDHLATSPPYFIMAHDGATAGSLQPQNRQEMGHNLHASQQAVAFREMILFLTGRKFNVALINELQWRDTKVITEVLESRTTMSRKRRQPMTNTAIAPKQASGVSNSIKVTEFASTTLSERHSLAVTTVVAMLREVPAGISQEDWVSLSASFLLHQALLDTLPLSKRCLILTESSESAQMFLDLMSAKAITILEDSSWQTHVSGLSDDSHIADFVDGRLFLQVCRQQVEADAATELLRKSLEAEVTRLVGSNLFANVASHREELSPSPDSMQLSSAARDVDSTVLPFSNTVFDKHLESVHIDVDTKMPQQSFGSQRIFQELSHWHNSKPLLPHKAAKLDPKAAFYTARRNQRYMAEMQKYAASLTNSVGRYLEPEVIISGLKTESAISSKPPSRDTSTDRDSVVSSRSQRSGKKTGGAKSAALNASKKAMLDRISVDNNKKVEATTQKKFNAWQEVLKNLDTGNLVGKYTKAQTYLTNLPSDTKIVVGAEVEFYLANCLVQHWIGLCQAGKGVQQLHVAAMIWNHTRQVLSYFSLPKSILKATKDILTVMELPKLRQPPEAPGDRVIPFTLALPKLGVDLSIGMPPMDFQLLHCGPYLERSFNPEPDERVDFQPDDWQRKVLDTIDADQSVFVVAPTSAGKTFISFYAMRKVLQADDESVLVYVAPTKALVNQIAAEIQARYSKNFKHGGKSVWAIHTRDHRVNNPNGCQVLVTVPHILQIMLLAPSNARSWSHRVKRIIFDEIHAIGQAEDGVVWEQLLLMAPCPIIGLSATVGNPDDFSEWLESTQTAIGNELVTVQHPYRYSDLRKYYHVLPKRFNFNGIPDAIPLSGLGLDGSRGLNHIHPVAALVDKSRGVPEDLSLEPQDCYYLWKAMRKVATQTHRVAETLNPASSLPEVSRKMDILAWEHSLKVLLHDWLEDPSSPFDRLLQELGQAFRDEGQQEEYITRSDKPSQCSQPLKSPEQEYISSSLALLCRLQERDALPAILFNYDRVQCEKHGETILTQLQDAEKAQIKSGPKWEKKLVEWEEWRQAKDKLTTKASKTVDKKKSKKAKDDQDDGDKSSKTDLQKDAATRDSDKWEWFDPNAPAEGYTFADYSKMQNSEIQEYIKKLRYQDVQPWLIDALYRGIGIHHAGMPRSYRTCVEMLFRKRFLRIIIATGTLALGINMPCKTVVFSGDSVFLTALNYRQCAGRGGRRGFDLLGNVVFHGVSREKVCRLISSRLPDLNGHFPITTSLVLRLFNLLHDSAYSSYSVRAIDSLLSQPRLHMGGESFKDQTMHHLRFSIEYLRRQNLLSSNGEPLNFAGLVSHLYYTENSSFAFHALLKEGYLSEMCGKIDEEEQQTLSNMMLVMSHLFQPVSCRRSDIEFQDKIVKPSSSIVFLPPLPDAAEEILRDHNQQTLQVYKTYVKTFVEQHIKEVDNTLPLSGLRYGCGDKDNVHGHSLNHVRSAFVGLSGHDDVFTSIHDLCATTRQGVFLEEAVIPYMPTSHELEVPLNAWLYDFFKHGDVHTIEKANGIRRADIWFRLNDFSLVLATIVTSLSAFLKVGDTVDVDMLDVQGSGDMHEEAQDDKSGDAQDREDGVIQAVNQLGNGAASKSTSAPTKLKKAKVLDSWDDDEGDDEMTQLQKDQAADIDRLTEELRTTEFDNEGGLLLVLKAFKKLKMEFDIKFKAMWA